jgi:hypothetical protein
MTSVLLPISPFLFFYGENKPALPPAVDKVARHTSFLLRKLQFPAEEIAVSYPGNWRFHSRKLWFPGKEL